MKPVTFTVTAGHCSTCTAGRGDDRALVVDARGGLSDAFIRICEDCALRIVKVFAAADPEAIKASSKSFPVPMNSTVGGLHADRSQPASESPSERVGRRER